MLDPIKKPAKRKLWPHQAVAIEFAIDRLNNGVSPCLIRMPTGTGKTGIAACLTRLASRNTSLVLTPWAHLRDQMVQHVAETFWEKVQLTPNNLQAVPMLPSTATDILKITEPQVIVATFATLNDLRLHHADVYKSLASAVSLVIVDEGHYEPAMEWGKSVKGLNCKTLLLTATPYRNDLKLFRIIDSKKSTHHFTHERAVATKVIRELRFEELVCSTDIVSLSAAFATKWKLAKRRKTLPCKTPRAIVCCSGAPDIEQTVASLRRAGLNAFGVHEQFENSNNPHLRKDVPDPRSFDAEIWVHQHKLTEGLDDHRFCCIALFTRIRNDRKLIQQIGRALRRNVDDAATPAVVFAPPEFAAEAEWNAYLEFETDFRLLEPTHFRDVVETLLKSQPPVEYFEGRFRRRFRPDDLSMQPQVIIPPSVLVRSVGRDFSLDDYIEDCTDTLNTEDAVILGQNINGPCQRSATFALWVYASVRNSRFLQSTSLYEIKLETHCVVLKGGFVFIADSRGNFPSEYIEERAQEVPAEQLVRYLDAKFRVTQASVDSSIPYDTVLRGADVRGHNLLSIPASLTDRVHICRSARGSSKGWGRRYVGINNGRLRKEVSEQDRRSFALTTFVSWAESVAEILNSNIAANALFQRYMPTCAPPANPVPKAICLDLVRLGLSMTLADGRECSLRNSSSEIKTSVASGQDMYKCSFDVDAADADDLTVSLRLDYQPAKRRFWFAKDSGASVRVSIDDEDHLSSTKSLAEFLNQRQELVLVGLDGGEIVYQGRNFYKIDYSYAEDVLLDLIQCPTNGLPCTTEKGTKAEIKAAQRSGATTFATHSLFRAVVDRRVGLPFSDNLLICTDLGTECADFVAANPEKRQLALIHAKAGTGTKISASAFHDIVAQAMKTWFT